MLIQLFALVLILDLSEGFAGLVSIHSIPAYHPSNLPRINHARDGSPLVKKRATLLRMVTDPVSEPESKDTTKDSAAPSDTRRFLIAGALSLLVSIPVSFLVEFLGKEQEPAPPEIQIIPNVDEDFLAKRKVRQWDTWESSSMPSNKFDYTYEKTESVYILEGEAVVTPKDGRKAIILKPNVFASFPKGLSCVWEVKTPVRKLYKEYNSILSFE